MSKQTLYLYSADYCTFPHTSQLTLPFFLFENATHRLCTASSIVPDMCRSYRHITGQYFNAVTHFAVSVMKSTSSKDSG